MPEITRKDVEYIAKLARIDLEEKDIDKYQKELSSILDFVSKLQKVDTDSIKPLSSVAGINNITRQDLITNKNNKEALLKNAPKTKNGSIVTNKVLETGPSS
jgi:aspartyl-tRNA(Asn)/glutamyl-tRNA(Gln) amidotransferase subunit C